MEIKNYTWWLIMWYAISFLSFLPLCVWMNNGSVGGVYEASQWSIILKAPHTYLIVGLYVFVICLPRIIYLNCVSIIWYSEFNHVKGE